MIVIPVPIFEEAKVNTGDPPKLTSSPDSTPVKVAVPVAEALVFPSCGLSSPVSPVMVNSLAVMSADKVGCVNV